MIAAGWVCQFRAPSERRNPPTAADFRTIKDRPLSLRLFGHLPPCIRLRPRTAGIRKPLTGVASVPARHSARPPESRLAWITPRHVTIGSDKPR